MAVSEAQRKILREIERIPGRKKYTNTNIEIICPFHGGSNPHCGIYVVPNGKVAFGYFNCFSCPEKGPWNKLAEKLGLEKVAEGDHKVKDSTQSEIESSRRRAALLPERDTVTMPYGVPYNEDEWREIPGDLIREIGGKLGFDDHDKIAALYLPIMVERRLVAVIKARLQKKKGRLSYIIQGGNTQVKQNGLFPYNKVEAMLATGRYRYLVIVEGPRDALKLISLGIPAIAILGTKMWGSKKRRRVLGLCVRYNVRPLVMMDGDKKGRDGTRPGSVAQKALIESLATSIRVEKVNLVAHMKRLKLEELDPATLPKRMYKDLRKLVQVSD